MGNYVIEVGNYLSANPSDLGNYVSADSGDSNRQTCRILRELNTTLS